MGRKARDVSLPPQVRGRKTLKGTEIRRLVFRLSEPIHEHLPWTRQYFSGGDEYHLPADRYLDFRLDAKKLGYELTTIFELYYKLPQITYERLNSPFRLYSVPDPERWKYLSPVSRRWRRAPTEQGKLRLRQGWALIHFPENGWREFYMVQPDKPLAECGVRGDHAILKAYRNVLDWREVPYFEDASHLYIIWPKYVIPKKYAVYLEKISPEPQAVEMEEGEVWIWRTRDRRLIDKVLRDLHLRLRLWTVEEDWVETFALIVTRAYGQYLSKKSGINSFIDIVSRRAWGEIEDDKLRPLLAKVGDAERNGSKVAKDILTYLSERVGVSLSEKDIPSGKIYGILLESDMIDWRGQDTGKMYYRVGFPELGLVASWMTKQMVEWRGKECPAGTIGGKWRLLPVFGRLRTTPGTNPEPLNLSREKRDRLKATLEGIPKIEWQMANDGVLDAMVIDFDDENWRGHNDLMRYSYCCSQVIRRMPAEFDEPSMLMKDILGFQFILETAELHGGFIPSPTDWVSFICRINLRDTKVGGVPVFHLVTPCWLNLTRQHTAEIHALSSVVKYLYSPSIDDIKHLLEGTQLHNDMDLILNELLESGELVTDGGRYYWRYPEVSMTTMKRYLETKNESVLPFPYCRFLPTIHPLYGECGRLRSRS